VKPVRFGSAFCLVVLLLVPRIPAVAQRISLRPDSMAAVLARMSTDANRLAELYLWATTDTSARRAMERLRLDTTASSLILAALVHDPDSVIRTRIVSALSNYAQWSKHEQVVPALRERVRSDASFGVVAAAAEALQRAILIQSGAREAFQERITRARASGDTALLRLALEHEEELAHLERPVTVPYFMRTPPPVFAATTAGQPIRFAAIGDYGLERTFQQQNDVALALQAFDRQQPLTFGITTGDNFYPAGLTSPDDPRWKRQWEDLYAPLGVPFYASLGNHDWYGDPSSPAAEIVYGRASRSWKLPAIYYSFSAGPAQFFAVNTNALTERQLDWLRRELKLSTAKWKVVYGHFPIYEATNYSVEEPQRLLLPILKEHNVDLYVNGHHHSMQHFSVDGIEFVTSGAAGASVYSLGDTTKVDPRQKFARAVPGFAVVDVTNDALTLRFVGRDSQVLYTYTRRK
jgi:tartrate-resistant acid phosphatase type 5